MKLLLTFLIGLWATPLASMAHTYLQVVCEPGVQIYVNEELKGTSKWSDGGLNIKITPGNHIVSAQKEGFVIQTTEISLRKSDVEVWKLQPFTPLEGYVTQAKPIKATYGCLEIYSRPEKCKITLVTPSQSEASWPKTQSKWSAQKLPVGKYTVKAMAQGKTLSYDIEIPPSGGLVLYFDFHAGAASLRNVYQQNQTLD
ncbi:MAG: hypothetical protein ACSHX8_06770 [Opitutaceae bacterium]